MTEANIKVVLKFLTTVLVTGGLGLLAQWANITYQDAQINMEIKKNDAAIRTAQIVNEEKYLTRFLEHALSEDVGRRYLLASYFAALSQGEGYKEGWQTFLKSVKAERDAKEQALAETKLKAQQAKSEEEKALLIAKVNKLEDDLETKAKPVEISLEPFLIDSKRFVKNLHCPEGSNSFIRIIKLDNKLSLSDFKGMKIYSSDVVKHLQFLPTVNTIWWSNPAHQRIRVGVSIECQDSKGLPVRAPVIISK